jgi:phage baseplate assembly protein gpV
MTHPLRHRLAALAGALLVTACAASAQDTIAGNWTLEVDSPQGLMKVGLVLNVEGEALKGSISSEMGEATFSGTAKDGAVTFTFDMAGPQGPMTITTKATVEGDGMKGEMDYGMGVAPFTGKRAEQ